MEIKRQLIRILFVSVFLLPILNLVFLVEWGSGLELANLWKYFYQSLLQASLSTLVIAVLGFVFCIGLIGLGQTKTRKFIMALCVLPAFAPTIFIVISFQTWVDLFSIDQSEGLAMVVLVHGLMNTGLAGTLFLFLLERGLKSQASLSYIEGASRFTILKELLYSKKKSFLIVLISFFGLCFTSFAIPLILGGQSGGTLEILAYKRLSEHGDLLGAFFIMALQWVCFFLLIRPLTKTVTETTKNWGVLPGSIGSQWALLSGYLALLICLGGMFFGLAIGFQQFNELLNSGYSILPLWGNSLFLSLCSAMLSFILYLALSYLWVDRFLHKFSIGFGSVSSVLLGLSIFVMNIPMLLKLGFGLSILFFPLAYRIFGSSTLVSLSRQCEVAELLGSSRVYRFKKIVFPQVLPSALRLSGVVAFWSIGEYAFSSVVTGELFNLGLLAKSFMLGYRIELAVILNWIILLTGGFIFLLFLWSADVCRRKIEV